MKPFRISFLILALLLPHFASAGNENQPIGARRVGLGSAYAAVKGDFWQLFMNPSGIAGLEGPQVGAFFERRYLLSELNSGAVGFVYPFKNKHYAGIDFGGFGFGDYNESRIGLTYATSLFDRLSLGAKVNYSRTSITNYGASSTVYLDLGLSLEIVEGFTMGARIFNANQAELDREIGEEIPSTIDIGLGYQVTDRVLVVVDAQKQVNFPVSFRGGIEYKILDFLQARVGASTAPVTLNLGIGLEYKDVVFDFSNSYHEYLGYTPSLSLSYRFNSPSKDQ